MVSWTLASLIPVGCNFELQDFSLWPAYGLCYFFWFIIIIIIIIIIGIYIIIIHVSYIYQVCFFRGALFEDESLK